MSQIEAAGIPTGSTTVKPSSSNPSLSSPQQQSDESRSEGKEEEVVESENSKPHLSSGQATSEESRPTSRTNSIRQLFGKGGFLSLLFCCTSGAASYFDHGHKSSTAHKKAYRQSHATASTDDEGGRIPEKGVLSTFISKEKQRDAHVPTIITDQTELSNLRSGSGPDTDASGDSSPGTPDSALLLMSQRPVAPLLPSITVEDAGRKCLVLDLDETLVHSSFKYIPNSDFTVPVEIDNQCHNVYVLKRPGVDEFMRRMGKVYEIVVFTASLSKYADPVLDILDMHKVVGHRLFRESCYQYKGTYVKDLSQLGRELSATMILDNSPASYIFHNSNAVPVSTWFNDPHDTELTDLVPFLEDLATVDDVTVVLDSNLVTAPK